MITIFQVHSRQETEPTFSVVRGVDKQQSILTDIFCFKKHTLMRFRPSSALKQKNVLALKGCSEINSVSDWIILLQAAFIETSNSHNSPCLLPKFS